MSNLNLFLESLKTKLPAVCTDRDLVKHLPNFFKNACTIHRMRERRQAPPHFNINPNIYYLRDDVVTWAESKYCPNDTNAWPTWKSVHEDLLCVGVVGVDIKECLNSDKH